MTRREVTTDSGRRTVTVLDEPEIVVDHRAASASESDAVTTYADGWTLARGGMRMFNSLVAFVLLIVETLLAFRLAFALGGANAGNGFVQFIYDASNPFSSPFSGIANHEVSGKTVFEPETVIAMAVWLVVALIIVAAVNIALSAPATSRRDVTTREQHAHIDRTI